jgi:hypothetical protein
MNAWIILKDYSSLVGMFAMKFHAEADVAINHFRWLDPGKYSIHSVNLTDFIKNYPESMYALAPAETH